MFTQGLDKNAVKWIQQGSNVKQREIPISNPISQFGVMKNSRIGFGLPPTNKFRSGHLPSGLVSIPVNDSELGSDMDLSSDSDDDDVYAASRYSFESSPQDHRIHMDTMSQRSQRYAGSVSSEGGEFCSSRKFKEFGLERLDSEGYESSDSGLTSDYPSTQIGSNDVGIHASDGYSSGVPSKVNAAAFNNKDVHARNLQNKKFMSDDIPSAPPFRGAGRELDERSEQSSSSIPFREQPNDFVVSKEANISKMTASTGDSIKHSVRIPAGVEVAASSVALPARVPVFHASSLGSWCAVLAYDACVRLCLYSWARGCTEAPTFLENECALLRNSFGNKHI